MHISAKTEYASIAMLELAASYGSGAPVRIRRIAEAHGIPPRFLVQILLQLKGAGLVTSTRGAAGGYQLAKQPHEITLGDVMAVVEGPAGQWKSNAAVATPASRVLLNTWRKVAAKEQQLLESITLADLVEQISAASESMYYI